MSGLWFIIGGSSFMLAAVISDPWGRKPSAAALFLLGAAMLVIGIAS